MFGLVDFQRRKQPCRCVTVCLGLMCALLLAANIGQIIYYQLQTRYETLRRAKEQLQTNYSSLATGRDQLQVTVDKLTVKACSVRVAGQKFDMSCYFVSTTMANWTESRRACVAQGADLVVMGSRAEQVFVNGLLSHGHNAWIGLTDSVQEGTWMWLDGTPVTTTYWQPGQPNSHEGNQDCGELVKVSLKAEGEWNDDGCFGKQVWICEK
uniref:C-type lectin domain-containing protein n=1 Tax=Scophthalmus maximus TaxID=52904 RepID=A0A8D3DPN4_SCOMX